MMDPDDVKDLRSLLHSLVRKAGQDDPAAFAQLVGLLDGAAAELPDACAQLRANGYSWADIGDALGRDRSAPRKRFGRR